MASGQGVTDIIASELKVNRYPLLRVYRYVIMARVVIQSGEYNSIHIDHFTSIPREGANKSLM